MVTNGEDVEIEGSGPQKLMDGQTLLVGILRCSPAMRTLDHRRNSNNSPPWRLQLHPRLHRSAGSHPPPLKHH